MIFSTKFKKLLFIILNKTISSIKKEEFHLDENISLLYILKFVLIRTLMYIRGFFTFYKLVMIGKNTTILSSHQITFQKSLSIDNDCVVNALSKEGIVFGSNVSIHKRTIIECTGSLKHIGKGLIIGNNVGIGSNSFLGCAGGIEIGDDTIIGNFVSMHSENHNFDRYDIPIRMQGTTNKGIKIGQNCWIGAKVTILDGSVVGSGSIIAAGAVLNGKTYPPNSLIAGVPARVIKSR